MILPHGFLFRVVLRHQVVTNNSLCNSDFCLRHVEYSSRVSHYTRLSSQPAYKSYLHGLLVLLSDTRTVL